VFDPPSWVACDGGSVGTWEAEIEALSIWQNLMTYFEQLERHLLDEIFVLPARRKGPIQC